jgi:L-ribulose-5-phosphate 3-epimerase UlaE
VQQEERERQRQEQLRIAREQYLQKMDQEAQRKKQAQDVMLKLENEERELINRLRKTQELQEKVGTYHVQVFPVVA